MPTTSLPKAAISKTPAAPRATRRQRATLDLLPFPEIVLLRPADIVEHTGWSRSSVYAMIASEELPSVRRGKDVRVPLQALREYISAHLSTASTASIVR